MPHKPTSPVYDMIIIGGGITGVTLARLLQQKGMDNVLVLEAKEEAGGLCRSTKTHGHLVDIGGGHFLNSIYPEVYDFIFSHIPRSEFNEFTRISKIELDGHIIDYPIESNLWQLPDDICSEYLISAVQSGEVVGAKEPKNYDEWITWKLGERIADVYMRPYNQKIWGVKPKQMDIDWLNKIPRLNTKEIVLSCIAKHSNTAKFPSHATFLYPKKGGFQRIFDSIYVHVKDRVLCNTPVKKLERRAGMWTVNNTYRSPIVVNTAPWPYLNIALGKPVKLQESFSRLKPTTLVVSLWEEQTTEEWNWMYYPDMKREEHRRFCIPSYTSDTKPHGYFSETNIKRWPGKGKKWRNGRKPLFEHINDAAYPIPMLGHAKAIDTIRTYYASKNLFGIGRWGQWKYFNSDVCMHEAMEFVKQL